MPRHHRHLFAFAIVTLCVGVCVACFVLLQTGLAS